MDNQATIARQKRESKLEQLCAQLSTPAGRATSTSAADYLSSSTVASQLFRGASSDFLENKTIEELKIIAAGCQELLTKVSKEGGKLEISYYSSNDRSNIIVGLG